MPQPASVSRSNCVDAWAAKQSDEPAPRSHSSARRVGAVLLIRRQPSKNISVESGGLSRDPESLELFASDRVKVDPPQYPPRSPKAPPYSAAPAMKREAEEDWGEAK
jgi:hypothetical protein